MSGARMLVVLLLLAGSERAAAGPGADGSGRYLQTTTGRGDTPAKLARRYYGDPERGRLIAAANQLPEKARLTAGRSVRIPTAWSYRIREGDTWSRLARDYLGDARRGKVLAGLNGKKIRQEPPEHHVIIIPAVIPIRDERPRDVTDVAVQVLRASRRARAVRELARIIRSYNFLRSKRIKAGQTVLVPLRDLQVQSWYLPSALPSRDPGDRRAARLLLARVTADLRAGRFVSVVRRIAGFAGLSRLDDAGLAVRLHTALCTAYVALGRRTAATRAARAALRRQPDLALDPAEISPKVRTAFARARKAP